MVGEKKVTELHLKELHVVANNVILLQNINYNEKLHKSTNFTIYYQGMASNTYNLVILPGEHNELW